MADEDCKWTFERQTPKVMDSNKLMTDYEEIFERVHSVNLVNHSDIKAMEAQAGKVSMNQALVATGKGFRTTMASSSSRRVTIAVAVAAQHPDGRG